MQLYRLDALTRNYAARAPQEQLLLVAMDCASLLVRATRWRDVLPAALVRLGETAYCERIMLYRFVDADAENRLGARLVEEWARNGLATRLDDPRFNPLVFEPQHPFRAIITGPLAHGRTTQSRRREMCSSRPDLFQQFEALAALAVPVRCGGRLWGVGILIRQHGNALWTADQRAALLAFADLLGASIDRGEQRLGH